MFQYFNELPLGESIEITHLTWKSYQHRLAPKYDILRELVPLVKHYFVTMEKYDDQLKVTCQGCNVCLICKSRSREIIYIISSILDCLLLDYIMKISIQKISTFSGLPELKCNACIRKNWMKVMVITITSGVQIFKTTTLRFCVNQSHRIK